MWEMMNYGKTWNPNQDRMLYLNGSKISYRCECGCNVFRQINDKPKQFKCNACKATYTCE